MRVGLWASILLASSLGLAQNCTSYVVAAPVNPDTSEIMGDLKAADFEASLGDTPLTVVNAKENLHSRVLILVESTTVAELNGLIRPPLPRNSGINQGIVSILNTAIQQPGDQPIAFGVFAERTAFSQGFLVNPQDREASVKNLMAQIPSLGQQAFLLDALHDSLRIFGTYQPGDTILLVADVPKDQSHLKERDVENEFVRSGVRLVFVNNPYDMLQKATAAGPTIVKGMNANLMDLVSVTGGIYTADFVRSHMQANGLYNGVSNPNVVQFGASSYLLEISLPNNLDKPKKWKLKLRKPGLNAHNQSTLLYPAKLPPCNTVTTP